MKKFVISIAVVITLFLALAFCTSPVAAQTAKEEHAEAKSQQSAQPQSIYKLDLVVYELQDGKKTNIRKYLMFVKDRLGYTGSLKVGNRIPILTGTNGGAAVSQMQYLDVGLNIRCSVTEKDGMVLLETSFELGSLTVPERSTDSTPQNPVIRQMREDGSALIALGKPTVVVSLDDTNSPRTVQLEVTATKL